MRLVVHVIQAHGLHDTPVRDVGILCHGGDVDHGIFHYDGHPVIVWMLSRHVSGEESPIQDEACLPVPLMIRTLKPQSTNMATVKLYPLMMTE